MNNIMVTIVCTTFNHEKYIGRTIKSFLNQETTFEYEILIHDDASSDKTQDIIKFYKNKYPQKIKTILQTENQWSKGANFEQTVIVPYANGKYIAICEGDDYWIDNYKLQKQVDYMEAHEECTFCFTNGIVKNVQNGKRKQFIPYLASDKKYIKEDGNYYVSEVAKLSFIPTCTFLFPKKNYDEIPQDFYEKYYCGDRRLTLYFTALGYAHCIDIPTGCYNYGVEGSAMTKWKSKSQLAREELTFARLYQNINKFTDFVYNEEFSKYVISYLTTVYCLQGKNALLSQEDFELLEGNISIFSKVKKILFTCMSDKIFNFIRNTKRKYFI